MALNPFGFAAGCAAGLCPAVQVNPELGFALRWALPSGDCKEKTS
jgi:hypothetical protein